MKKVTNSGIMGVAILIAHMLAGPSFGQTPTQQTASQVLNGIVADQRSIPLSLYPPEYLDTLQSLGDSAFPMPSATMSRKASSASPMDSQMEPMDQQSSGIPIVDGTLDAAYGPPLTVQTINTGFGDSTVGNGTSAGGSELDAAYGIATNGFLYLFLAGNFEDNANHINIFIADGRAGQNTLSLPNTGDMQYMNGSVFSPGFQATYAINLDDYNETVYVEEYSLVGSPSGGYVGTFSIPNGVGAYAPDGIILYGWNDTHVSTMGTSGQALSGSTSGANTKTGIEMAIPLSLLGNPQGQILVLADINDVEGTHLSNQFLPGLPVGTENLGTATFNFGSTQAQWFAVSVLLPQAVLNAVSTVQTSTPTYGGLPVKDPNKNGLVIITHGWTPKFEDPSVYTAWVDQISNSIAQRLTSDGNTNWQVFGYKWPTNSWVDLPDTALNNGKQEGIGLGLSIVSQGWSYVHLIAHSAGAALIEACAEVIKKHSPSTVVQCTFLDAYVGSDYAGITNYGSAADWSDNYFSRDLETGGEAFPLTQGVMTNAYNVDVTQLDTNDQLQLDYDMSTPDDSISIGSCYKTESTHFWPVLFYSNTITAAVTGNYDDFGWPLSQEEYLFVLAKTTYYPGNNPAQVLGSPDPVCSQNPLFVLRANTDTLFDFIRSIAVESVDGTVRGLENSAVELFTGSPVWAATVMTPTNTVNLLSFDAEFESGEGAHGLLSVYWDADLIGLIDEGAVQPGLQHYSLSFPTASAGTSHVLGLHLDPFTSTQSVVLLTNVVASMSGIAVPVTLSLETNTIAGLRVMQLTGPQGYDYTLQASSDLTNTNWTDIEILGDTNGTVQFIDPNQASYGTRFYRVVVP
jgi:hypothetical protein